MPPGNLCPSITSSTKHGNWQRTWKHFRAPFQINTLPIRHTGRMKQVFPWSSADQVGIWSSLLFKRRYDLQHLPSRQHKAAQTPGTGRSFILVRNYSESHGITLGQVSFSHRAGPYLRLWDAGAVLLMDSSVVCLHGLEKHTAIHSSVLS